MKFNTVLPPQDKNKIIQTVDLHTEGEPLRVILSDLPKLNANTLLGKRNELASMHDHFRKVLINEPRGHSDMYGCYIIEADHPEAEFGIIFIHNEGYSTMCGHATIAISKLACIMGWVETSIPLTMFTIQAPCGLIQCSVEHDNKGYPISSHFVNVPSYCLESDYKHQVPGIGNITCDVSYGGAFYLLIDADSLNLEIIPENLTRIIQTAHTIKQSFIDSGISMSHPYEKELEFLYGVIFYSASTNPGVHSKNVCVFANGEVDRSPTGSGVSARLAAMYRKNQIEIGEEIIIESIIETTFSCEIVDTTTFGDYQAVVPKVGGTSFITGKHEFILEGDDNLPLGFNLRN